MVESRLKSVGGSSADSTVIRIYCNRKYMVTAVRKLNSLDEDHSLTFWSPRVCFSFKKKVSKAITKTCFFYLIFNQTDCNPCSFYDNPAIHMVHHEPHVFAVLIHPTPPHPLCHPTPILLGNQCLQIILLAFCCNPITKGKSLVK